MDHLTIIKRIKIIKIYYKNNDSVPVTYPTSRGDYGLNNRPTKQAISKIMKKFEGTEEFTNIERLVHHRFARSAKKISLSNVKVLPKTGMGGFLVVLSN